MGSLMAGWDSHAYDDPERVRLQTNRSLTKEEIAAFWRLHGGTQEDLEEARSPTASSCRSHHNRSQERDAGNHRLQKSGTRRPAGTETPTAEEAEISQRISDWWTRSNWAFLNEPPLDEIKDTAHKYTPQFRVAELATQQG